MEDKRNFWSPKGGADGLADIVAVLATSDSHAFMDEHTFEIDRIKQCCTHYALSDGRLMSGCAYNMFYRHKDPRLTGPKGRTEVWGKTARPAASGTRIPLPVVPSST